MGIQVKEPFKIRPLQKGEELMQLDCPGCMVWDYVNNPDNYEEPVYCPDRICLGCFRKLSYRLGEDPLSMEGWAIKDSMIVKVDIKGR